MSISYAALIPGHLADNLNRNEERLAGTNHLHWGPAYSNYITLPIIPN